MDDREQKIREYAHRIWEEEGRPEGGHADHWRRAEQQHEANEQQNAGEPTENWKVEAGLTDSESTPSVMPTVIPPD